MLGAGSGGAVLWCARPRGARLPRLSVPCSCVIYLRNRLYRPDNTAYLSCGFLLLSFFILFNINSLKQ